MADEESLIKELPQGLSGHTETTGHGVAWAAAFVEALRPQGGRVLDLGCANGQFLTKLDTRYTKFGIQARDLADPTIAEPHRQNFEAVIAIAVLEHLPDIRSGMARVLELLKPDGFALFELPLSPASRDSGGWLDSPLAIRHLVEVELGAALVGADLVISDHGSIYVGVVFRKDVDTSKAQGIAERVLALDGEPRTAAEVRARMLLRVHAGRPMAADLDALPTADFDPQLLGRLAELWKRDLSAREVAQAELAASRRKVERIETLRRQQAERADRLQSDLEMAEADRVMSHTELTTFVVATQARLEAMQRDRAEHGERARTAGQERAELEQKCATLTETVARLSERRDALAAQHQAALEAELAALRRSRTWRLAASSRALAVRYPLAARLTRNVARIAWWTARGKLLERLRLRQHVRRQLRIVAPVPVQPIPPPPAVKLPSAPERLAQPAILSATGHRQAPEPNGPDPHAAEWPLVSIVITSFNYGDLVAEALDSALNQTFRDLEVIVVEGGSSNPSSRFVVAGLRRARTRVLMQGAAHSPGANRNYGISQSRGRYVCCLDADDMLAPTYIEKAVYLLERQGYDVVSSGIELFGNEHGTVEIMETPDLAAELEGNHVLTCAVFRRSFWEQGGGFRDVDRSAIGHVHEDWVFWVRLAALGARFRNLPLDPMLKHRVHPSLSRGKDVLPIWQQRHMVRRLNDDVLHDLPELIARSRRLSQFRAGTPLAPPPAVEIDGPASDATRDRPALLLAVPFLVLGGAERLLSSVVAHLARQGWRVVIVTSLSPGSEHGDTTPWFEPSTTDIFHLPRAFPPEVWDDFIGHLIRSRNIGIAWVVGSAALYDRLRTLRAAHPRLRVADLLFNTVGHTKNNRRWRDLIDLIFVENSEVRDWLLGRGEDPERIILVESGVNLGELRPLGRSKELTRTIKASASDLIVGFSGRWSEEKNPLGFIEIARRVDEALPIRFVMTGTGHMRSAVEQAVADARFPQGRFHLLGAVPDIAPVLGSFDLLVLPSILDGRPVVVLEALAMGVPVLASRVGALPELIQPGVNGWLCDPADTKAFAARIEHAGRHRAELEAMRGQARAFAEAHLDAQTMLSAYERGLASLLPASGDVG